MKNLFRVLVVGMLAVFVGLLPGCSGSDGDSMRYDPGLPEQVTGLEASAGFNLVSLSWYPNAKAEAYNIYYVSELMGDTVTKIADVDTTQFVVSGLDNNVTYHFMVTAINRNGEGPESLQVSATPDGWSTDDLTATWYFHTLVTGPDAKWERGTMVVADGNAVFTEFEDSSGNTSPPEGFTMSMDDSGGVSLSGGGAWIDFQGFLGSRKNMLIATHSPSVDSGAITIFQKKREASDYSIADISGTGSGQNPDDPNLMGNGPTRYAYHQLYSGSNTEWEYCNAKVGQNGNYFAYEYKDMTHWDFSNPTFKSAGYDFFWKATSLGITSDGLVEERWNFVNAVDPAEGITSYNDLTPKQAHDTLFTGRMTDDKTVIVGVATRTDANGQNPQYFLRIIQLCFKPADQTLPEPDLPDLMGNYRFSKLGFQEDGGSGLASWAYGTMAITGTGETSFPQYADSLGNMALPDTFTLSYYPDQNPDGKLYRDFANFTSAPLAGKPRYVDANGDLIRTYFDFSLGYTGYLGNYSIDYSLRRQLNVARNVLNQIIIDPETGKPKLIIPSYYNEHGTLSLNKDLFVMTRTDTSGDCMIIGLK